MSMTADRIAELIADAQGGVDAVALIGERAATSSEADPGTALVFLAKAIQEKLTAAYELAIETHFDR